MTTAGKRVLIVDDDVDFVEANRVALEARGFEVLAAHDSQQGAELALHEQPDLIIVDLMMEQLYAGFSLVQHLCAHEETCEIPLIMASAVTTETGFRVDEADTTPEWLQVREFLNKPVDPVQLADKVAAILEQA